MNIKGQFYDGIVGKPDLDDALEHYGIKGMKWKVRKAIKKVFSQSKKRTSNKKDAMSGDSRYKPSEKNLNAMYKDSRYAGNSKKAKEMEDKKKNAMYGDSRYKTKTGSGTKGKRYK